MITICEIKYTEKPFAIDKAYMKNIENKIILYKQQTRSQKHVSLAFISANGLKQNSYSEKYVDNILSLNHLFE